MLIIGEKINALNPMVANSLFSGDLSAIVSLAISQAKAGADVLDVNLGPDIIRSVEIMREVVTAVQQHVDVSLCLNGMPEMIEAGLRVHKGRAMINGVTSDRERRERLLLLAREFHADIIGMAIPENGHADDADAKCGIAMELMEEAKSRGISLERIYLDPVISSFLIRSDAITETVRTIQMFRELFPGVKTVIGLNNISEGIKKEPRPVMNSTALGILSGAGLDAAIMNPMDRRVMETAKMAKLLCRGGIYCDSYLCS